MFIYVRSALETQEMNVVDIDGYTVGRIERDICDLDLQLARLRVRYGNVVQCWST